MVLEQLAAPAYVLGRHRDVLVANALAVALHPGYAAGRTRSATPSSTRTGIIARHPDVQRIRRTGVAALRAEAAGDPDDPRLTALVGELSVKSEAFRRLWARHDVRAGRADVTRLEHPLVGALALGRESLATGDGQVLVVPAAPPGSADEQRLALLGSLAVSC